MGDLSDDVRAAAQRPDVRAAVADVYARLRAEIDRRRPACAISGRCCKFEEYGHRLYVTTIELAAFVHAMDAAPPAPAAAVARSIQHRDGTGCPFQVGKLCGVHAIRPFGCRMFFCDASATDWQQEQYERFHAELKRLHEELGVPYAYVEWRAALKVLGLARDDQHV